MESKKLFKLLEKAFNAGGDYKMKPLTTDLMDKETKLGFENTEIEVEQVNNLEQLHKANLQTTLFPMLTVFLIWLWKALCILFHKITFHRWDADLIKNVLDAPNNARGFYKGNPQYYYNGFWVVLNGRCDRVLKYNKIISKVCQKKQGSRDFREWYSEFRAEMARAFSVEYCLSIASWTFSEKHKHYYYKGLTPIEAVLEYAMAKNSIKKSNKH